MRLGCLCGVCVVIGIVIICTSFCMFQGNVSYSGINNNISIIIIASFVIVQHVLILRCMYVHVLMSVTLGPWGVPSDVIRKRRARARGYMARACRVVTSYIFITWHPYLSSSFLTTSHSIVNPTSHMIFFFIKWFCFLYPSFLSK